MMMPTSGLDGHASTAFGEAGPEEAAHYRAGKPKERASLDRVNHSLSIVNELLKRRLLALPARMADTGRA